MKVMIVKVMTGDVSPVAMFVYSTTLCQYGYNCNVTIHYMDTMSQTCDKALPFPALSLAVAGPVQTAVGAATRIGKPGEKMIYLERGNKCSEIWCICFRRQRQYAWQAYYVEVFQGSEIITFIRI